MLPKLGSGAPMPPNAALSLTLSLVCSGPLTSPASVSRIAPSLLTSESLMPPSASLVCFMPFASPLSPLPPLWPMLLTARTTLERFFPASARLERSPTLERSVKPRARSESFLPESVSICLAASAIRLMPAAIFVKLEAPCTATLSRASLPISLFIDSSALLVSAVNVMESESTVSAMILNPPLLPIS